jgi:ribonucleoside-diphosphate reductase alpha chain
MVQSKTTSPKNVLHELGYKIFLDRYAQKDMTRATLAVGDTVIVVVDAKTGQREIGKVTALDLPKVQVQLLDGETVERDVEHVDKPLETDPGQMMDRVAAGIASVESTPELQKLWAERFRWLLDDWKFVPAGRILAAAGTDQELTYYNCMPPDQELLTADGYKPIGDVKVGDLVVTHRSRLRPVLHKFERETDEPLYIIRPKKIGFDDLRVTGDHKIYIIRSEWVNKHNSRDGLRLKQEPDWIPAKDIKPGDYVAVGYNAEECPHEPIRLSDYLDGYEVADGKLFKQTRRGQHGYIEDHGTRFALNNVLELDGDLCYLFGRWLGDGCITHRTGTDIPSGIKIVFNLDEKEDAEKVAQIIEDKFGIVPSLKLSSTERWYDLWANSLPLGQFFKAFLGYYSYGKRIPDSLMHLQDKLTLDLLRGLFSADGYVSDNKLGIVLSNRTLAVQVYQLLLRLGYLFSIRENTHRLGRVPAYRIQATANECGPLFEHFFDITAPQAETDLRYYFEYDNLKWVRIDEIAVEDYSGVVMDIEVAEDHSFISAGVVVSNCYVIPSPRDSRGGIIETLRQMTEIMSRGGGVGINVSSLRPRHAYVKGVNGRSSGAVSWGGLYSFVTGLIEQGGSRRGALMLILDDWHPDVFDFINSKRKAGQITNANISVGVSDKLMEAVKADGDWTLMFPDTSEPGYDEEWDGSLEKWMAAGRKVIHYRTVKARAVWDAIIESAWASAEPGVWFRERYNKMSNSWYFAPIISTNPCVTGDTRIYTNQGLVQARELFDNETDISVAIDGRFGLTETTTPSTRVFMTGYKPVYRLQTHEGYFVRATIDHRFMTPSSWVEMKDLKPGDKIHILNRKGGFGTEGNLTLGRVLGWLVGDGTFNGKEAVLSFFGEEKRELAPSFAEYVNEVVQPVTINLTRPYNVSATQVKGRDEARVSSARLMTLAAGHGLTEFKHRVPEIVFKGTEEMQRGFLQALFTADGSVQQTTSKAAVIRLASSQITLLEQVQQLLANFGIASRLLRNRRVAQNKPMPDGKGGLKEYRIRAQHELHIAKVNVVTFAKEIGFLLERKNQSLVDYLGDYKNSPRSETYTVTVESILYDGEEAVFDITEPKTHSMVVNGIVAHQCGEQGLPSFGVCNLGAINLARFYDEDKHDVKWDELEQTARFATRFLDNVIDSTPYFFEPNRQQQMSERRVGLNNMGLAELLIRLGIRYGSDESVQFIDKLYGFLARVVYETSTELAQEKGAFPQFDAKKFLQSGFMKSMPRDIRDKVKKRGIRNVTLLTQAPTGCVAPDTLVSTAAGLRPIIELGDADGEQWQIITQDVHTDEGLRKTSHFYINGYAPVKTMTTRRGFSLTATHNHRIRIIDAGGNYVWRRMDELAVGDRVVLKKNTLGDGETIRLASVEQGNRALSDLPPVLTPDLAELLGLYMGDGFTKRRGGLHIVVCKRDPDLLTHVQSLMKKVWGEDRQVPIEDRQGCWVANLTGYYIPRFFEANGFSKPQGNHGEGAEGAFIPSKILQAGRIYVAAFLRGLFEADGGVHRGTISLVSTSKRLLNQAQVALLGLGIVATIREIPRSTGSLGQRAKYELRIINRREGEKFAREIGFISQRKRDLAANLGNIADRGDSIAVPALCEEFYAKSKGLKNEVRQQIIGLVRNGALSQQFVKQTMTAYPTLQETRLGQLVAKDIFIDDVASVEDGACLTYDLSVPDNQTYIANGFVSHNTTGTMVNTSTGIEPFFSWVYYRKSRLGLHEEQVPLVKEWFEAHPDETDLPDYFVTAMDLTPEEHVKVQGAIQRWVDSSISKCVVGDTLVLTDEGLLPIEDLSEMREPDTFADLDITVRTSGGHSRATAFYYNGMRPTLRLSLAYGFEIEGTHNHPVRVLDADGTSVFKPLSALRIGDIVPLYIGQRQFGRPGKPLPAYQGRWDVTNTKPIRLPGQMSEELAYLLGCITSEGTIGRNGVSFVNSDRQIVERVAGLFESLFDMKCRIERDNRRDSLYYVRANSRALRSWLVDELGMLPGAKNKTIPNCILGASAGEIGHFLRGLFLDAYMTLDGKMFGIGLASRKLLKQLQVLLLNFGIVARMHKAGANAWSVTVAGSDLGRLAAITAFDEVWKNERMARRDDGRQMKARSYSTLLPEQVSGELHQAVQENERSLRSLYPDRASDYQRVRVALMRSTKIRRQDAYEVYQAFEDTSSDYLKQFFAHDKEGCVYLEVKAIQSGFAEVFDITVPDGHEFIANGICNHNTANLPNNYTIEQTRALYEYMYELGCKGGTVYRDGSRDEQVLMLKEETTKQGDKKAEETRPVEQVATPHRVYPRPRQLAGVTVSRKTPFGTAFITMNSDEHGNPFEVFITVGKAGSDLQADAEGLGRMISLQLRTTAPQNRKEMLKLVIDQLQGIGGSRSVGMGPSRVMSLPDAVAGALMEHYFPQPPAQQLNLPLINGSPVVGEPKTEPDPHSNGIPAHGIISGADICPDCGLATLVRAEGCEKCLSCGYSRC